MKKVLLATTLIIAGIMYTSADAQVRVSISANTGRQPMWGPAGCDYAQFYYLSEINMYYDVQARQFVYFDRGRWVYASTLPWAYRNYDLYRSYKVVMNEPMPYLHNYQHRYEYRRFKDYRDQQAMNGNRYGNSNDGYDHRHDNDYDQRYNDRDDNRYNDGNKNRYDERDNRDDRYDRDGRR